MAKREISACGMQCEECVQYKVVCPGCDEIQGKVYWAKFIGAETCPMYMCCVRMRQLAHCGQCEELPCDIFFDTQDPSYTIEEHLREIQRRVKRLRELEEAEEGK